MNTTKPERASGVSAADKYAELGPNRPHCECHNRLMLWEKGKSRAGGYWRCAVERYENTKRQRSRPGTWAYKEVRALGVQGAKRAQYQRVYRRAQADSLDDALIAELETKLRGLNERSQDAQVGGGSDPSGQAGSRENTYATESKEAGQA